MSMDTKNLRANVATPWRLQAPPNGGIHPEHVRRAYMNEYADLQRFKLKVTILLLAAVLLRWWLS